MNQNINKLNKTEAFLLTHVVCFGPDFANTTGERRAANRLEKLGFVKLKKEEYEDFDRVKSTSWRVYPTEKGKRRVLFGF